MVAPEAEVPEAVLRSPRYFSPGGFRIGSAARHRAQARGGQGEDQADPQQQIGFGGSGTAAPPAGWDKEISLLYRRRQAGAATLVHRHLMW